MPTPRQPGSNAEKHLWRFAVLSAILHRLMGYFFRRSAKIGPFRLNFSKSGIGASLGVKGARLTMTPRGTTYITAGSHGFYYRETIAHANAKAPINQPSALPVPACVTDEITTADVADLVDSSSENLINRLNERAGMGNPAWLLYALAVVMVIAAVAMFSAGSDVTDPSVRTGSNDEYATLVQQYGYPDLVAASNSGVPIRTAAYGIVALKIVFVPNDCVTQYHGLGLARTLPAMAPCMPLANGWSIVGYKDAADGSSITAELAKRRLDKLPVKETMPPKIRVEPSPAKSAKKSRRTAPQPAVQDLTIPAWAVPNQPTPQSNQLPVWAPIILILGLGVFVLGLVVHKKNTYKRTSRIFYELGTEQQERYRIVQGIWGQLSTSHQIWRINAESATSDWKRNAGASSTVRRSAISVTSANPPLVQTNLAVPCIDTGDARLYFLPDVILYRQGGRYGGIAYHDFRIQQGLTRFIEDGAVPADATVVDRTWRYVNKSGGPDRRFKNNAQLPVVRYGVLVFSSARGLNIHFHVSNAQASTTVATGWTDIQRCVTTTQTSTVTMPSRPPTPYGPVAQACKILGVTDSATGNDVSALYHRLAQQYHPDKVAGLAPEFQVLADRRMKEINAAYEILKNRSTMPSAGG
jgi:hypothetical protein